MDFDRNGESCLAGKKNSQAEGFAESEREGGKGRLFFVEGCCESDVFAFYVFDGLSIGHFNRG